MPSSKYDDARKSPGPRRRVRSVALLATLGWIAAALLIADKIHAENMAGSLHNALVRSQTARHQLSRELQRMSDELEGLEKRLSRYQDRETQAAASP